MRLTFLNWGIAVVLMLLFLIWNGAFARPLSSNEIETYLSYYRQQDPEMDLSDLEAFLKADDGKPIVMLNLSKENEIPAEVNGQDLGQSSEALLTEYTNFVLSFLFRRGSYPIYTGTAAFEAMETWGVENVSEWTNAALMRYQSRRVMMDMTTDPRFDQFHDKKIAALEKTIAVPTTVDLSTSTLSWIVFLTLLSTSLAMQLLINSRVERNKLR